MKTTKTKVSERLVKDNIIRFVGRVFYCPELIPLSGTVVNVAFNAYSDTEVDIVDERMNVIATASVLTTKAVA